MPRHLAQSLSSARRPTAFVGALLVFGLLAACTGAPPASPTPIAPSSPSPTGSPSPAGSPIPTAPPTTPPSPTSGGDISHPTGATDVVLRLESGGGMVAYGWLLTDAPHFTLYGDGTVLFRPLVDPERPGGEDNRGMARYATGQLSEEEVQALLTFALGPGRLLGARDTYPQNTCADCGLTIFTLSAGGQEKVVTVHDRGMPAEGGPDAADRRGFAQLADVLRNFDKQQSGLDVLVLYDAPFYRVGLLESFGAPAVDPLEWPWDDLSVDDFVSAEEFAPRLATLSREQVAEVVEVPSGGHPGIWVLAPDDTAWTLTIRPLLPDEIPAGPPLDG